MCESVNRSVAWQRCADSGVVLPQARLRTTKCTRSYQFPVYNGAVFHDGVDLVLEDNRRRVRLGVRHFRNEQKERGQRVGRCLGFDGVWWAEVMPDRQGGAPGKHATTNSLGNVLLLPSPRSRMPIRKQLAPTQTPGVPRCCFRAHVMGVSCHLAWWATLHMYALTQHAAGVTEHTGHVGYAAAARHSTA